MLMLAKNIHLAYNICLSISIMNYENLSSGVIKEPWLGISQEVQAGFVEYVQKMREKQADLVFPGLFRPSSEIDIKLEPQNLLAITVLREPSRPENPVVQRVYHSWNPSTNEFYPRVWATFVKIGGQFAIEEVGFYPEYQYGKTMREDYVCVRFGYLHLNLQAQFDQRFSEVGFDDLGFFAQFSFRPEGGGYKDILTWRDSLKLLQEKFLHIDKMDKRNGIFEFKIEDPTVRGKRIKGGNICDEWVVPLKVDVDYLRQRLIHPLTLLDPIDTSSDLDVTWRLANVMGELGFVWKRLV